MSDNAFNLFSAPLVSGQAMQWTKYMVSHTALQAALLTNDIELVSVPAKTIVMGVIVKHSTASAGTLTYTLSVGITGTGI